MMCGKLQGRISSQDFAWRNSLLCQPGTVQQLPPQSRNPDVFDRDGEKFARAEFTRDTVLGRSHFPSPAQCFRALKTNPRIQACLSVHLCVFLCISD